MIYETLKKRKDVREYDSSAIIPKQLIDSLLQKAWEVTPSKNRFMPYNVHVLGPEHTDYKKSVYQICLGNERYRDNADTDNRYTDWLPQYGNILSCSHLFIFTVREEDAPNPYQLNAVARGRTFDAMSIDTINKMYSNICLEVGLFADALSGLCLENDIDVSYSLCFRKDLAYWKDVPFINRQPVLLMTAGKGKVYTQDFRPKGSPISNFYKPSYERIVKFIDEKELE